MTTLRSAARRALLAACLLAGALVGAGCSSIAAAPPASPLVFAGAPEGVSGRVLVLAVANPRGALSTQAGTTPGLYEATPRYTVGESARRLLSQVAQEHGLKRLASWPIPTLGVYCATFLIPEGASREAVLAELAKDPRLSVAQPLNDFETMARDPVPAAAPAAPVRVDAASGYNDPYLPLQHGLQSLDVLQAHRCGRGAGVTVAVIDTGVDTAHADLREARSTSANFVDEDVRQFQRDFHGTAVAGVIGATPGNAVGIVGIAPEAQLLLLKACWQAGPGAGAQCNSFTLAQALSAAIDRGAQVINLSLGGPADDLLTRLVRQAELKGIVVVGAVPPNDDRHGFPAGVPGVIAVREGAVRDAADTALTLSGRDVLTLSPGGRFDFTSGSSLATAEVSGIVALLLQHDPHLGAAAIEKLLRESAFHAGGTPDVFQAVAALDHACGALATR
jgi:subtilisin family serine protease